ncbi:hypothetical protein EVAR_13438_1 [Eumeta japonica]|uniref:Uncharacterized protein n=1 Tax=Eumeta variegata TaxID=151549 RepID=A0A4C1V6N7_EUMVA|nr:hypothetical protein EVAR_13438_1 [Eumeta japonica]
MRRAQARQSYIFRYVVILLRVYWRKVTRARRTASADWCITPGTAGMRPRDLFTTSRDYRESVGPKELRSYLVSHDTTRFSFIKIHFAILYKLPNQEVDPELFDVVKTHMIYVPCGSYNPQSPCMKNGIYSKRFPKSFTTVLLQKKYPPRPPSLISDTQYHKAGLLSVITPTTRDRKAAYGLCVPSTARLGHAYPGARAIHTSCYAYTFFVSRIRTVRVRYACLGHAYPGTRYPYMSLHVYMHCKPRTDCAFQVRVTEPRAPGKHRKHKHRKQVRTRLNTNYSCGYGVRTYKDFDPTI